MASKSKGSSKASKKSEEKMARAVRESAKQIWKAGLGAFVDQQRSSGAIGDKPAESEETVNTLEQVFQERVSRVLDSVGAPTREEFDALAARVDKLRRQLAALDREKPAKKTAAKKATARKPAARKAASRKSVA